MQIVRTIVFVVLLFGILVFSWANWDTRISVRIWEELIVETNAPALMIISFLAGFLPLWLLHRSTNWRLKRRIRSLEKSIRDTATIASDGGANLNPERPNEAL
ncbi:MAG TPA: DUF1049 domain-containing protein [Sphingomonadaceae bacterium]|nr:DUF1049 domain-containing protein [Sphingomonadaceae bacterium]